MRVFDLPERPAGTLITPETELVSAELLDILASHIVVYPTIFKFVTGEITSPSELLTPIYFDQVRQRINQDSDFYLEVMTFMDTLTLLDVFKFGLKPGSSIDLVIDSIVKSRAGDLGRGTVVMEEHRERGTLSRNQDQNRSTVDLRNNRELMALYLFALVVNLYNLDIIEAGAKHVKKA